MRHQTETVQEGPVVPGRWPGARREDGVLSEVMRLREEVFALVDSTRTVHGRRQPGVVDALQLVANELGAIELRLSFRAA